MDILIQAAQLILSLSILVILHEGGHFLPAKLFKMRVEKFYLFFDPWFSLLKVKKGDTEYGIGWVPLGGYVKISGMIDESMDKEQMKLPAEPWEFRSKPAWQRLIVMIGGVTVNVILGILIYAGMLFVWGEEYLPTKNAKYGIACDSLALQMGLKDGDKILSVGNVYVENFNKIPVEIILNSATSVQVERDGQKLDIPVSEEIQSKLIKSKDSFISPRIPCIVDTVLPGQAALKAGLLSDDKFVSINGEDATYFQDVVKILQKNIGKQVDIIVDRKGDSILLKAEVSEAGKLGFGNIDAADVFEVSVQKFGLFESFPAGIRKGYETFQSYIKQMKILFTVKDAHESIGSFISIGKAYGKTWDWQRFWGITAFLSIVLAIMNILPIPALDGGHVMFLLYEMITGKKPGDKFMEYAQIVGMVLLLSLMVFALGNDIFKLFTE
jgi:regulator of sigma E protease